MTNVPKIQITDSGLKLPTHQEILSGVLADINAAFGGGLNTESLETPQGQLASSLAAVIADIAPKPQEKTPVPAALLSDGEGGKAPEEGGAKLSAATGESSLNKGAHYV